VAGFRPAREVPCVPHGLGGRRLRGAGSGWAARGRRGGAARGFPVGGGAGLLPRLAAVDPGLRWQRGSGPWRRMAFGGAQAEGRPSPRWCLPSRLCLFALLLRCGVGPSWRPCCCCAIGRSDAGGTGVAASKLASTKGWGLLGGGRRQLLGRVPPGPQGLTGDAGVDASYCGGDHPGPVADAGLGVEGLSSTLPSVVCAV
jgi:hypothetical protein